MFSLGGQAFASVPAGMPVEKINIENTVLFSDKFGAVTQNQNYGSPQVIINIQDLHSHPQVQKNIASILENLDNKYKIKAVYLEGGSGKVDVSWLEKVSASNNALIDQMIKDGSLTGVELFAVTNNKNNIYGLENTAVHRKNLERLGMIYDNESKYTQKLNRIENEVNYLYKKYSGKENKKFSNVVAKYRSGKIDAVKYYEEMIKAAERINANPGKYDNIFSINLADFYEIQRVAAIDRLSKQLDTKRLNAELQKYLSELQGRISYSEYRNLLENTDNLQDIGMAVKYIRAYGVDGKRMPQLKAFVYIKELSSDINPVELYGQEQLLREKIMSAFSASKLESETVFLKDFYMYFSNYMKNNLTAADEEYFNGRFELFSNIYGKYAAVNIIKEMESEFPVLNSYYAANNKRNEIFIENIEKNTKLVSGLTKSGKSPNEMLENAKEIIVVVSGGYHSRGLNEILDGKKISHMTITPRISGGVESALANYRQIITEQSRFFKEALAFAVASQMPGSKKFELIVNTVNDLLNKVEFNDKNIEDLRFELEKVLGEAIRIEKSDSDSNKVYIKSASGFEVLISNENNAMQAIPVAPSSDLKLGTKEFKAFMGKAFNLSSLANIIDDNTYDFWKKIFFATTFDNDYADGFYPEVERLIIAHSYDRLNEIDGFPIEQLARTPKDFQMKVVRKQLDIDSGAVSADRASSSNWSGFKSAAARTILGLMLFVSFLSITSCSLFDPGNPPGIVQTIPDFSKQSIKSVESVNVKTTNGIRQLVVENQDGKELALTGKIVCVGPEAFTYYGHESVVKMMNFAGATTMRLYELPYGDVGKTLELLNYFKEHGITVIMGFSVEDMRPGAVGERFFETTYTDENGETKKLGNHSQILFYEVGNEVRLVFGEWVLQKNKGDRFDGATFTESVWNDLFKSFLSKVKSSTERPFGTVFADVPDVKTVNFYKDYVSIMGVNCYRGHANDPGSWSFMDVNGKHAGEQLLAITDDDIWVYFAEFGISARTTGARMGQYDFEIDGKREQSEVGYRLFQELKGFSGAYFALAYEEKPGLSAAGHERYFGVFDRNGVPNPMAFALRHIYNSWPDGYEVGTQAPEAPVFDIKEILEENSNLLEKPVIPERQSPKDILNVNNINFKEPLKGDGWKSIDTNAVVFKATEKDFLFLEFDVTSDANMRAVISVTMASSQQVKKPLIFNLQPGRNRVLIPFKEFKDDDFFDLTRQMSVAIHYGPKYYATNLNDGYGDIDKNSLKVQIIPPSKLTSEQRSALGLSDSDLELPQGFLYKFIFKLFGVDDKILARLEKLEKKELFEKRNEKRAKIVSILEMRKTIFFSSDKFVMQHYRDFKPAQAILKEYLGSNVTIVSGEYKEAINDFVDNIEHNIHFSDKWGPFLGAVNKMKEEGVISAKEYQAIYKIRENYRNLTVEEMDFLRDFKSRRVIGERSVKFITPAMKELINKFKKHSENTKYADLAGFDDQKVLEMLVGSYNERMQGIGAIKQETKQSFWSVFGAVAVVALFGAIIIGLPIASWLTSSAGGASAQMARIIAEGWPLLLAGVVGFSGVIATASSLIKNFKTHVAWNLKHRFAKLDIFSGRKSDKNTVTADISMITTQNSKNNEAVHHKFGVSAKIDGRNLNIPVYIRDTNNINEQNPTRLKTSNGDSISYRYTKDRGLEFSPSLVSDASVREISQAIQQNPDTLVQYIKEALKEQGITVPKNIEFNIVEVRTDKRTARPVQGFGPSSKQSYDRTLAEYESDQKAPYFEYNQSGNPQFNLGDTGFENFDLTEIDDSRIIREAQGWMFAQRYFVFLDKINTADEFQKYIDNNIIGKVANRNIIITAELAANLSSKQLNGLLSQLRKDGMSVMVADGASEEIKALFDGVFYQTDGVIKSPLNSVYETQKTEKLDNAETFAQDAENARTHKGNVVVYESAYAEAYKNNRDGFAKFMPDLWTTVSGLIRIAANEPITPETAAETAKNFNTERILKAFSGITVEEVKELRAEFHSGERLLSVLEKSRFGANNMAGRYLQEINRSVDDMKRIETMMGFAEGLFEKLLVAAELNQNKKTKGFNNRKTERLFGEILAFKYGLKSLAVDLDIDETMRDLNSANANNYYEKMLMAASKKAHASPIVATAMAEMMLVYAYTPEIDSEKMSPVLSDSRVYSSILSAA